MVRELAADSVAVAVACRVLGVSSSGYYGWRDRPPSARSRADLRLVEVIRDIHTRSRQTHGSPRVHAELRLGHGIAVGRKRVERLMRAHRIVGVHRRRPSGCIWRDPTGRASSDLVNRQFLAGRPDQLWVSDIVRHEALFDRVGKADYMAKGLSVIQRQPMHEKETPQ